MIRTACRCDSFQSGTNRPTTAIRSLHECSVMRADRTSCAVFLPLTDDDKDTV